MNPLTKRLLLMYLDELDYNYSNASCNDFNLKEVIPDQNERYWFLKEIDPDFEDGDNDEICNDHDVLEYVRKKVEGL